MKYSSQTVKDLLTENRFWVFWSPNFSTRLNVSWEGSIKWSDVMDTMRTKLGAGFHYERAIEIKKPDIKFL